MTAMLAPVLTLHSSGLRTLEQRALAVIRSLGGDAIYVQNGFPSLWSDSAGTTPVTAVGDVIGRVAGRTGLITATQATTASKPVIARLPKRLGPELVTNGGFDSDISGWTTSGSTTATWIASGMQVTRNGAANTNARQAVSLVAGKTYLASIDVTTTPTVADGGFRYIASADGSVVRYIDGTAMRSTVGTVSATFTATVTENALVFVGLSGWLTGTVTVDNVSIKEVINTSNAISFDGAKDFLTTGVTTGNEGWMCAGVVLNSFGDGTALASSGGSGSPGYTVYVTGTGGQRVEFYRYGTSSQQYHSSTPQLQSGTANVIAVGYTSSQTIFSINDAADQTFSATLSPGNSATALNIGRSDFGSSWALNGQYSAFIYTPVLPSESQRQLIRRWVGSLQGQNL